MKVFSVKEVADLKHVSRDAIYKARRRGILPSLRTVNGTSTTLFAEHHVRRYIAFHRRDDGRGIQSGT